MRRSGPKAGGYTHHPTDHQLREWMATPAKQKLRWLTEAARFSWHAAVPETRELRERLRRGEI